MQQKMERITVTVPNNMLDQVQQLLVRDGYQNLSEWVRHAIRQQIARDRSPLEKLIMNDPRMLDSLKQAERGVVHELDWEEQLKGL